MLKYIRVKVTAKNSNNVTDCTKYGYAPNRIVTMGDLDYDSQVSNTDILLIQQYMAELITLNDEQLAAADVNYDGVIDQKDIVKIQKYMAELIPEL